MEIQLLENSVNIMVTIWALVPYLETNIYFRVGLKYKIVEDSVIPSDRSFRDAWEVDEAELTDGVGS